MRFWKRKAADRAEAEERAIRWICPMSLPDFVEASNPGGFMGSVPNAYPCPEQYHDEGFPHVDHRTLSGQLTHCPGCNRSRKLLEGLEGLYWTACHRKISEYNPLTGLESLEAALEKFLATLQGLEDKDQKIEMADQISVLEQQKKKRTYSFNR